MKVSRRNGYLLTLYRWSDRKLLSELLSCEVCRDFLKELFIEATMQEVEEATNLYRACNFELKAVLQSTVGRVLQAQSDRSSKRPDVLAVAPTQAGKSAYKAAEVAVYITMGIHTVLLTKGKRECQDLAKKLKYYFDGSSFQNKVLCVCDDPGGRSIESEFLNRKGCRGSVLVSLDSYQKIRLARTVLRSVKVKEDRRTDFCLLIDEVDAIVDRSKESSEKNEIEMAKLLSLRPTTQTLVTATPMPTIVKHLLSQTQTPFPRVFHIQPNKKNYIGVDHQSILRINDTEVYLGPLSTMEYTFPSIFTDKSKKIRGLFHQIGGGGNLLEEIAPAAKFPLRPKHKQIPAWNEQCDQMMASFFADQQAGKRGLLLLVSTCPWTARRGNVFDQATFLQDRYFHDDLQFVAIVIHAENIFYRLPGYRFGFQVRVPSQRSIGDVIQAIDRHKDLGLDMPVVVFGYHKLNRSISYRSDDRVPTHMILSHGKGQSNETVRQAAGRATFVGRHVLVKNTKSDQVKVLMNVEDYSLVQMHDAMVMKVCQYAQEGMSLGEILQLLPPDENYLLRSNRKTGVFDILQQFMEDQPDVFYSSMSEVKKPQSKRARLDESAEDTNDIDA